MRSVEWFYDFVSPYSYLQCERLTELPPDVRLLYRPVLFAALLNHWGHKGPAEIPSKRTFTYRSLVWRARQQGIDFRIPRAHPFNPLPLLRLSIAADNRPDVVRDLFRFVWREGKLPQDPQDWSALVQRLDLHQAEKKIGSDQVKRSLRDNTEYAIEKSVFGVPTLLIDGEIFWGSEFFDFALDYLAQPGLLQSDEMRRVSRLPTASQRIEPTGSGQGTQ